MDSKQLASYGVKGVLGVSGTRLDVSRSTIYRDIGDLREAGKIAEDGDRLIVLEINGHCVEPVPAEV